MLLELAVEAEHLNHHGSTWDFVNGHLRMGFCVGRRTAWEKHARAAGKIFEVACRVGTLGHVAVTWRKRAERIHQFQCLHGLLLFAPQQQHGRLFRSLCEDKLSVSIKNACMNCHEFFKISSQMLSRRIFPNFTWGILQQHAENEDPGQN